MLWKTIKRDFYKILLWCKIWDKNIFL